MLDELPAGRRRKGVLILAMTLARIPLAIAFAAVLVGVDEFTTGVLVVCGVLLVLGEVTDFMDGRLARRLNVVTEWGAMLDPYADSISRLIIYWALARVGSVYAVVPLVMAFRDVSVAYCRIVISRSGGSVSANWSGKIKAGVQAVGSLLAVLGPLYWAYVGKWPIHLISITVGLVTLASMVEYVKTAARAKRA